MSPRNDMYRPNEMQRKRRNELAYLALYYAVSGKDERSRQVRRALRTLEGK